MCKHFNTPQGCSYGAKCQFAHGQAELRQVNPDLVHQSIGPQSLKNPLNYKIVKCKNFEKEGTCKYGVHCSFAHGDAELRNKTENLNQMQQISQIGPTPFMFDYNMGMGMPMPQSSIGYDLNQLNQMAMTGQFEANPMMMGMGLNSMPPSIQPNENNDKKA